MFKAVQQLDCAGNPLDKLIERDIYAVDRATDSFLIVDFMGQFTWIPMWTCRAFRESDLDGMQGQRRQRLKEYMQAATYALINDTRREKLGSKG